jgi:hypothetical protein
VGFASHDSKASAIHDFSAKVRQLIETANKNHQKNFLPKQR